MAELLDLYGLAAIIAALFVMALAGFIKGAVGFALPLVAVSGIGTIMSPAIAVAALMLPSLLTNAWQAMRQGFGEATGSFRKFLILNVVMMLVIIATAHVFASMSQKSLFLLLGVLVTTVSLIQLLGWRPPDPGQGPVAQTGVGVVAGILGGIAAIWGPPIVLYLLARRTPKVEMVRVQGLSYLLGSLVLAGAHTQTGILNAGTATFSAILILPTVLGMWVGVKVQDRLPQETFRKATMAVLVLSGLNLLRKGLGW